jgi:hydrophobic/amphiphilic exporter-1 (mainly G- bacteria), HAE1 family
MTLAEKSVGRPVTTLMFYIGVAILGVIALRELSVDFLPPIRLPRLSVQTTYADASPEQVERSVTQQVESALGTVAGVKKVTSVSHEGQSVVTVEFFWGTDMDFALIEAREKLDQARATLPLDAGRPTLLTVDPGTEPIMTLGATLKRTGEVPQANGATSIVSLDETVRALVKRRVEQVDGVAQAAVQGGVEREVRVNIEMDRLTLFGMTLEKVTNALSAASISLPGGTIKNGLFRYSLRTVGEFAHPDEIRHVVVGTTPGGKSVLVSDVAVVVDTVRNRQGVTWYNGKEIIGLQIRKEAGANTIVVSQAVHNVIDQICSEYPQLEIFTISDQAEFIGRSISDVEQSIVIGAVLAFLVLFFFLRRPVYPVIIGLTIPVSILATFIAMYFFRINLNIISLCGLALGIGMLGDNAIVLIENVSRLREQGRGLVEATLEGSKSISLAVTASTLTNVAIFLPVVFVRGVASQLFVQMGVTMTVSLLVSLVVAVTLVPMLVSRERPPSRSTRGITRIVKERIMALTGFIVPKFYALIDLIAGKTAGGMDAYLAWGVLHRGTVVLVTVALLALSVLVAACVTSEPAPDIDQSRFTVQLFMPKGTSFEGTSLVASALEEEIRSVADVEAVYATVGVTDESNFWEASEASLGRAALEVKVRPEVPVSRVMDIVRTIASTHQHHMHGVEFAVKSCGTTFERILRPQTSDIRVRIQGPDPSTAMLVARRFADAAVRTEGLVDFRTSLDQDVPGYRITVDRNAVGRLGLSVQAVNQRIAEQIKGTEAATLSDFDKKVGIRVIPACAEQQGIDQVLAAQILVDGTAIPLRSLVRVESVSSFGDIWRENQQRSIVFLGNVSGRSLSSVVHDLQMCAESIHPPPGFTIRIGGENEDVDESFRSFLVIIGLSIFLVYMILAAEYESILYPLVILLTSPLAFIGAIGAMACTGQHYNVMSLVGLVIMIGAVDNDAVIAVDIITVLRRQGMELDLAIRTGMQQRLRPILMTTATTVLGVVPLVVSFGTGSELVRAMAVPIAGGLLASTVFTVLVIPIVYMYIDHWAMRSR